MVDLRIHKDTIKFAMTSGVLDLLTVLPKEEVGTKGLAFVLTMMAKAGCDMEELDGFIAYFHR